MQPDEIDRLRAGFNAQGYVILPGFLEQDVVASARAALATLVEQHARRLLQEGTITDDLADAPFETRLLQLYAGRLSDAPVLFRPELHLAGMYPLFFHPRLLDVVEAFLGSEIRLYPNYSARPKYPDCKATEVLWHRDGGYTEGQGLGHAETLRMVNAWTPLVPAREENGCMEFIPGTHRLGIVPHERREYYLEIAPAFLEPRRDALPASGEAHHAIYSGSECVLLMPTPLRVEAENATSEVSPGDVGFAWFAPGSSWVVEKEFAEICWFYDRDARPSMPEGPVPVNIFARIVEGAEGFFAVCRRTRREGVKPFTIERVE